MSCEFEGLDWEGTPDIPDLGVEHPHPELKDAETAIRLLLNDHPWQLRKAGNVEIERRTTDSLPTGEGVVTISESRDPDPVAFKIKLEAPYDTGRTRVKFMGWGRGKGIPPTVERIIRDGSIDPTEESPLYGALNVDEIYRLIHLAVEAKVSISKMNSIMADERVKTLVQKAQEDNGEAEVGEVAALIIELAEQYRTNEDLVEAALLKAIDLQEVPNG